MEQKERKKINFSYNWNNKLNSTRSFSTIRYPSKKWNKGEEYDIFFKREIMVCTAKIIELKDFRLGNLTEGMAWLDTGYDKQETKNILKTMFKSAFDVDENFVFTWILLEVTDRHIFLPNNEKMKNADAKNYTTPTFDLFQSKDDGMGPSNALGV